MHWLVCFITRIGRADIPAIPYRAMQTGVKVIAKTVDLEQHKAKLQRI